jgi:membrane-associated protein
MNFLTSALDAVLHIDKHLQYLTAEYGVAVYVILFAIIFVETGLVIMPFLPGDSLLFAAGAVCGLGMMSLPLLAALLIVAAILGDSLNYGIGKWMGPRVFASESSRWLNRKHLETTHAFYERHGGKTIILARFIPIVRTFAPFVAGVGAMTYGKFIAYNIIGGVVWVVSFLVLGYAFGSQPIVKQNFTLVILGIIVVSILPAVWEVLRSRSSKGSS